LLVSVRSAFEARAATAGGAAIIDVKEPLHGPLGRASAEVWGEVIAAAAQRLPVSVALGELGEWLDSGRLELNSWPISRISYGKLGLADARPNWREQWRQVRERISALGTPAPEWVGVLYADWQRARAPHPDDVIAEALQIDECRGVLIDTWDKSHPSPVDRTWKDITDRIRAGGRFLALAGQIDVQTIERLAALEPDIIAVRGAACSGGDRLREVDELRVARLAKAAGRASPPHRSFRLR
jgi:uncharacterized protein (UPF0264 family)